MSTIHPSAVIGKNVQLGEGNEIGPGCVIEGPTVIGSRNKLWLHVYVGPGTTLGDENQLHMGVVIGHLPQDVAFSGAPSYTTIGHRNVIREYVTIHRGTKEDSATVIGDDNFLMANAHVAHNCRIGSRTIFVNLATLAGHCVVEDEALLSGMVVVHQFTRIGRLAMISGLSALNKDAPPFMRCGGRPAVVQGLNVVGMRRAGISASARAEIKRAYQLLYREGLNVPHALEAIAREGISPEVGGLVEFIRESQRGICAGASTPEDGEEESLLPRKRVAGPQSMAEEVG